MAKQKEVPITKKSYRIIADDFRHTYIDKNKINNNNKPARRLTRLEAEVITPNI